MGDAGERKVIGTAGITVKQSGRRSVITGRGIRVTGGGPRCGSLSPEMNTDGCFWFGRFRKTVGLNGSAQAVNKSCRRRVWRRGLQRPRRRGALTAGSRTTSGKRM